jgi:hypothetical protein
MCGENCSSKFINKDTLMSYLVSVDHDCLAVHPTRSDCEGFKRCCISKAVGRTDDDMLWNDSEEDGMLGVSMRKMQALTVKMETVTLIGKGR